MDRFLTVCKAHKLKVTPQRVAVYNALAGSKEHPSADRIHKTLLKEFPNISLDTVNRTLLTFVKIGIIDVVEGHGDPRRFDPNQEEHHHFYCTGCNRITDFHDPDLDQLDLPQDILGKFTITGKRLCLTGFCQDCVPQAANEPA